MSHWSVMCRWGVCGWIAAALLSSVHLSNAIAQAPPTEELPVIEIAPAPGALSNPEATERKIRAALSGDEPQSATDPVLDEVLQVIRKSGSVLDGSVLDPKMSDVPTQNAAAPEGSERAGSGINNAQRIANGERVTDTNTRDAGGVRNRGGFGTRPTMTQRARAAETLLKAARLLEQIGPTDELRSELVIQMRLEAVRLLVQRD